MIYKTLLIIFQFAESQSLNFRDTERQFNVNPDARARLLAKLTENYETVRVP